jgi:phosphatidylglycerol lysyltransferase
MEPQEQPGPARLVSEDVTEADAVVGSALARWASRIGPMIGLLLCAGAVWVLRRELAGTHLRDVLAHVRAIPSTQVALALALTVVGYVMLSFYDALALRYVGRRLAYRRVALMSFVSYVFSHNVGFAFLSGSAVRYRMLTSWGLATGDVARVVAFDLATFWLGTLAIGATVLLAMPIVLPPELHLVMVTTRPLGVVAAVLLATWATAVLVRRRPITVRGFDVRIPSPRLSAVQLVVASADWVVAAAVLWALLPATSGLSLVVVLEVFLLAQVVGVASTVPGGVGVFEGVLMLMLRGSVGPAALLGSLVVYRLIYYLLPLVLGLVLLGAFEARQRWGRAVPVPAWVGAAIPRLLALATFGMGVVLLLSGATPAAKSRILRLPAIVPLPVIEVSHLLGSIVGTLLLLLGRAVQRRVDAAYHLTIGLLVVGIFASLAKGLDWEEALALTTVLALFVPCRSFFDRHAAVRADAFSTGWTIAVVAAVLGAALTFDLAYRHVEYAQDLWWHFSIAGDASRSLRALAAIGVVLTIVSVGHLLRPARRGRTHAPAPVDDRVRALVAAAPRASAHLALLGDKEMLWAEDGSGFVMYGVRWRTWVSMGDPVGPPETRRSLAWAFQDLADEAGGWAAFYEVGSEDLGTYLEMGLAVRKLGEEARVPLADFSLEGSRRKALRYSTRRFARDGYAFRVAPVTETPALMDRLRRVSDAWLVTKRARVKRFSLGCFEPGYMAQQPVALVERAGDVVAFANLWCSGERAEVSPDLMRHRDDAPAGTMEFLFTELLLWAKAEGYAWCNLGMAPLAGVEDRPTGPTWNRIGALVYRHGEHFYGFRGLRAFKDKFDPVWEPRYLAAPAGAGIPRTLFDVLGLVSGGVAGVVTR